MKTEDLPHVEISVTFRGKTVKQQGCHFIDAIHFLRQAEKSAVAKRTNEKLRRLLGGRQERDT